MKQSARRAVPKVRVIVVDDHIFMRELICARLGREGHFEVVACVGTAAEAIASSRKFVPDLVVLDINLPDRSGIDLVPELKRLSPTPRVLLCTAYAMDDCIDDCLKTGADGFVEKKNTWSDFLEAVERVSRGEKYFCTQQNGTRGWPVTRSEYGRGRAQALSVTARESEVVKLIAQGLTSKDVARKLFLSPLTVDKHRTNLMAKLGANNVASLIALSIENGLI